MQLQIRRFLLTLALATLVLAPARADVRLNPLFNDHMVLQRATSIPIWGTADPGEAVTVTLERRLPDHFEASTGSAVAGADGRWKATLPMPRTYGPYTLTVAGKNKLTIGDVLLGEVWVCSGQSNMEFKLKDSFQAEQAIENSSHSLIRLFTVEKATASEPQTTVKTTGWHLCDPKSVRNFSAVGYFFGRDIQANLQIPVGLIHTSWGGTPAQAWTSKEALDAVPELQHYHQALAKSMDKYNPEKAKAAFEEALKKWEEAAAKAKADGKPAPRKPRLAGPPTGNPNNPSTLYNAMLAPLVPYAIRGAIWYQGESNAGAAYEYRTLFPTMIADWRRQWGYDFPFLCVQLAPFMKIEKEPKVSAWAELREAQFMAAQKLPNVGMAVITDVGEENDIHPRKKEPVGARLALLARKIAYYQPIVADGPTYSGMTTEGNRAVLYFANVGAGLECRGDKLTGFTIAGDDHKFHNAEAEIRGDTVVVHSPDVEKPEAVRFGWANYPVVNLWNKDGLPATPFRTDDWPGVTVPKSAAK